MPMLTGKSKREGKDIEKGNSSSRASLSGNKLSPNNKHKLNLGEMITTIGFAPRESEWSRFKIDKKPFDFERQRFEREDKHRELDREARTVQRVIEDKRLDADYKARSDELYSHRERTERVMGQKTKQIKVVLGLVRQIVSNMKTDH